MKGRRGICGRLLLWSLVLLLAIPPGGIMAQAQAPGGQAVFRQEELDQMLAPIALYPDELLAQVLMAATYPLEVVQAARWVEANPNLKGEQLAIALEQQSWDPSVKSLVNFPSILQMMNSRLDWMQMLGDAFLGQEDQVMNTVQQLRQRAQAQGNLRTTNEQRVIADPQAGILIEPVAPQVVYVPVYDPMVVYGTWWWPAYRPFYYHPPGVVIRSSIVGLAVAVGVAWGYAWGVFNWHQHHVVINVTRNAHINNHIDRTRYVRIAPRGGAPAPWTHDPVHRRGIAYRSPVVAQHYGRGPAPGADTRRDFRGFDRGRAAGPAPKQQQVAARSPGAPPPAVKPIASPAPAQQPHGQRAPEAKVEPRPGAPAQPPRAAGMPQAKVEPPRPAGPPVEQPRPTPPSQAKADVQKPGPAMGQPHAAPTPQVRVEAPRPAAPPAPQMHIAPAPAVSMPQARQPMMTSVRPASQAPVTAFGGGGNSSQAREASNRGRESLSSRPAPRQEPAARPAPAPKESPRPAAPRGERGGNPRGGR